MNKTTEEFAALLSQLGFSVNEITILIEIYSSDEPLKADELSEISDVPLTRTYEALDELNQKGFIEVQSSRPRKYHAKPPTEAIEKYISQISSQYKQELENAKDTAMKVLKHAEDIYLQYNTQIEPDDLLLDYRSLKDAEIQTKELINQAKKEILIFTHVFQWFYDMEKPLKKALKRGCSVKVLMQMGSEPQDTTLRDIDPVDISYLREIGMEVKNIPPEGIRTRGTLVDKKAVIFVIWVDPIGNSQKAHGRIYRPQYSSNQGIVEVFYGYFSHLWQQR